jgi:F-type H+-transporting ATPase subunit b
MDALSSLGINWRALISQIANFAILLILLRIFLYKPIVQMLEKRQAKIKQGLDDAEKAKVELESAKEKSQEIIKEANRESQMIMSSSQKQADEQISQAKEEARQMSKKIIRSAEDQAEAEKIKIITRAKSQIGEMVVIATEKIIQEKEGVDTLEKTLKDIDA